MSRRKIRLTLEGPGGPESLLVSGTGGSSSFAVERRTASGVLSSEADVAELPDGRLSLVLHDGRQVAGRVAADGRSVVVTTPAGSRRVEISDPRRRRSGSHDAAEASGAEEVRALMPGRVLEIFAKEGDSVEAGSVLLVLEAMKMQNEIRASRAGRVARVAVEPRQAVDGGALMILLEEPNRPDRPVSPPSG